MNRRKFIGSTGMSIAGMFMMPSFLRSRARSGDAIPRVPDSILAKIGGRTLTLRSADGESWTGEGILVRLTREGSALAVDARSETHALGGLILLWKHPVEPSARFLGDHWERSYGDLSWKSDATGRKPWYFLEYDGRVCSGFGVRTGCRAFASWALSAGELRLELDTRAGAEDVHLGDRSLRAAEIVGYQGTEEERPFVTAATLCRLMCESPRLPQSPVYGTNDWYYTYGKNSEQSVLENCEALAPLASGLANRPFAVVDAGWAIRTSQPDLTCWGDDFTVPNENFPDMARLSAKIRALGMRPGIWTRPLCANPKDPERLLIPGTRYLDPTIAENLERVRGCFRTYNAWGYELVKFDFTTFDILGKWGFQMTEDVIDPARRFHDRTKTNAEIILGLYHAIREAAGETVVLACNTVSHLSAGLFELCRIGDDTSGLEWDRTRKMGVNALGFRLCQHGAFYAADGDCVGLTSKVPWDKNKQWMRLLAESGTPLFVSASLDAMGSEQVKAVREAFRLSSEVQPTGEPLDWLENQFPARWKLNGKIVEFDWGT